MSARVIALLRAVNVGGRVLRMADLKDILVKLRCEDPQTLLQSGNAVFGLSLPRGRTGVAAIEAGIEQAILARCAIQSDVFIRTAAEWDAMIAANPFEEARTDPSHMVLVTLRDSPPATAIKAVRAAIRGRERVHLEGRALYAVYPDGIGPSKLTNTVLERVLGTRGTARNWNTVLKLQALVNTD